MNGVCEAGPVGHDGEMADTPDPGPTFVPLADLPDAEREAILADIRAAALVVEADLFLLGEVDLGETPEEFWAATRAISDRFNRTPTLPESGRSDGPVAHEDDDPLG